jgi:hypothetical protein
MRSSCWFLAAVFALGACGPAVTYDVPPDQKLGSGSGSGPTAAAGDLPVDAGSGFDIKGVVFEPMILEGYGVNGANPKKATTLAQQRVIVSDPKANRDPLFKQANATVLATMLYKESSGKTADERKALMVEAKTALNDAVTAAGKKADELTLELLGRYALWSDDLPTADTAWEAVVTQYPKSKELDRYKAWWGYTRLREGEYSDAAAALAGAAPDKTPEVAYVSSWVKWRTGDNAGAWDAMKLAVKGFAQPAMIKDDPDRLPNVFAEAIRMAARTGISVDDTGAFLSPLWGKPVSEQLVMWSKIKDAMHYAGRWQDAIATDDKILALQTAPTEKIETQLDQMDFAQRLDKPEVVGKYMLDAATGATSCGSACTPQDVQNVYLAGGGVAARLHKIYATSGDVRYFQPAEDLYAYVIPKITNTTRRQQFGDYKGALDTTHKIMKPMTGTLEKDVVIAIVSDHNQEVQACYETTLMQSPKAAGTITAVLDIDQGGGVRGATTDPKAGQQDISAVAGCVIDKAKSWKFPARGSKGSTRATIKYQLAPRP